MHNTDMDHIDPKWSEGRDYQIVCGLDNVYNMAERDSSLNKSKNNRFLPWRNSLYEVGGDPVEQGDLCLFLDPDTNEWVLEEFLGKWWFDKSKSTLGRSNTVFTHTAESKDKIGEGVRMVMLTTDIRTRMSEAHTGATHSAETKAKISESLKGLQKSDEHRAKLSLANTGKKFSAEHRANITKANLRRHARTRLQRMAKWDSLLPDFGG